MFYPPKVQVQEQVPVPSGAAVRLRLYCAISRKAKGYGFRGDTAGRGVSALMDVCCLPFRDGVRGRQERHHAHAPQNRTVLRTTQHTAK
jgi:hypothetical protein